LNVRSHARSPRSRKIIGAYHEEQLRGLLEHVREGFARLDRGEIDAFELDDIIHRYNRSARELWKFCGSSGSQWVRAVGTLEFLREEGLYPYSQNNVRRRNGCKSEGHVEGPGHDPKERP
jgi:hypothetical protein